MITLVQLNILTTITPNILSKFLENSGYKDCKFKTSEFVGITNGGQFAYRVTYQNEYNDGKDRVGKVFLTYDHTTCKITADC